MRWYAGWVRRLAREYEQPFYVIEQMPLGAFYHEIASLLGAAIVAESERLRAKTSDRNVRAARNKDFAALTKSSDPFDRLILEHIKMKQAH
jgi:hypothetical protein